MDEVIGIWITELSTIIPDSSRLTIPNVENTLI